MALHVPLDAATELGLPGRRSREIVSGTVGAESTLRLVEIGVAQPGAPARAPHWHPDCEEVIHVLSGTGVTWVDGAEYQMRECDTIRIAPGERHVTRNTGETTLTLLCFFPKPGVRMLSAEGVDG